jgi:hypothetical protein
VQGSKPRSGGRQERPISSHLRSRGQSPFGRAAGNAVDHHLDRPLDQRVAGRAISLALRPDFDTAKAATQLAAMASCDSFVLRRALARIDIVTATAPSRVRAQATAALRVALTGLSHD